ncbi:uncharacterized protein LOC126854203 [Cataglyphis hispanica]|uniref:uncharacterized protein LOC126854203 n=1 Tax=Cataglyphis hispanica TaxID=1086592 RepID=UPI00217F479B|nr:uncharacterized protein LOC126854203 [Cataglyphis hispanica]
MTMEVDDSHVAAALNALISESVSTHELHAKARAKRSNEKEIFFRQESAYKHDAGPFDVHIQRLSNSNSSLHPIHVGRIVCELNIKEILEIKKVRYSKVSIYFKTREAANILVENKRFFHKDLVAFIPPFRTSRKSIIKDVSLDLTEQMIISNISSPIKIVAANRLNRRVTIASNTNSQEDSSSNFSYVLFFLFRSLLKDKKFQNMCICIRYPISPYIARVSQCNHCFRFGHIQNNCKSQSRCIRQCGGYIFSTDNCPCVLHPSKCANCQEEHRADSSLCLELATQKKIRKYAAYRNISLLDAKEIFKEYILTNSISKSVIFTDSKSVTEALLFINLAHSLNHIIFAIKQKLYKIKSAGFENSIVWIPAHSGILGNETTDYLAKKAISKDPSCSCESPKQDADHIFWSCPHYNKESCFYLNWRNTRKHHHLEFKRF